MQSPASPPVPTAAQSMAAGAAARAGLPRGALASSQRSDRDATLLIEAQNADRVPELVPIRMQRMSADPVSFFRGSVAVMASDLGREPSTGIEVISSGDAHPGNFGYFVSPLHAPVFDLNDFDQACLAPWEWDVKRLMTGMIIAGRHAGFPEAAVRKAAREAGTAYRTGLADALRLGVADRYYSRADTELPRGAGGAEARRILEKTIRQARRHADADVVATSTVVSPDGRRVFVDDPPKLSHAVGEELQAQQRIVEEYRRTVAPEVGVLLSQHEFEDSARRVAGVGSVGTRCFVVLLTDPLGRPLLLQVKEVAVSVLQSHGGLGTPTGHEGMRVVTYQRVLQSVPDVFLGHLRDDGRDFVVRQFRNMKTTVSIASLTPGQFIDYARACAVVLARAHAQSPRAAEVSGYLGSSTKGEEALLTWSVAYAAQSEHDFRAFRAAQSITPR